MVKSGMFCRDRERKAWGGWSQHSEVSLVVVGISRKVDSKASCREACFDSKVKKIVEEGSSRLEGTETERGGGFFQDSCKEMFDPWARNSNYGSQVNRCEVESKRKRTVSHLERCFM